MAMDTMERDITVRDISVNRKNLLYFNNKLVTEERNKT